MKTKRIFLKILIALMAIPVILLSIFYIPGFIGYAPTIAIIGVYMTLVPFLFALFQAERLLGYIDQKLEISKLYVKAVRQIKYCGIIISVIYLIMAPILFPIAEVDDAPGLIGIPLILALLSGIVAVVANKIEKKYTEKLKEQKKSQ